MSWPHIVFTEADKLKFQQMALELEQRMALDGKKFKDLERFSQYPPFVEAIQLAKDQKINKPLLVPNTNYWYFETDLQDWMRAEGTGMLSSFLLAIKGFPYKETDAENHLIPDEVPPPEKETSLPAVEQRPTQAGHGWLHRWIFGERKK